MYERHFVQAGKQRISVYRRKYLRKQEKKKHEETQFWKTISFLTETSIGFTFQWSVLLEFINTEKCPLQNTIQIFYTLTSVCLFFILLSPYMFEDAGRENLF